MIDAKDLQQRVQSTGSDAENFYQTYDDDKIVKAINTIASTDNMNKKMNYAAYGGKLKVNRFDEGGKLTGYGANGRFIKPAIEDDNLPYVGSIPAIKAYQKSKGLSPDGIMGPKTTAAYNLDRDSAKPYTPVIDEVKPTPFVETTGERARLEQAYLSNPANIQKPGVGKQVLNTLNTTLNTTANTVDKNYGEALRYAPIASNAYQLSKLKKPTGVRYNTLDNRYKPTYIDEARIQNTVDQELNNQINSISQLGGSEGAIRNSILGAGLNKNKALSNAYATAVAQNASENQNAQQFNLGVDSTNIGINNKAIDEMRMDQGNYDTQKSKLISGIGTDIGSIGREISDKKQIANLLGYTWNGKYIVGKDGKPVPEQQLRQEMVATKSQNAYGGKLNLRYKK